MAKDNQRSVVRLEKRLFLRGGLPSTRRRAQILSRMACSDTAQRRVSVLDDIEHGGRLQEGRGA